jgi:RNA polymerase sigma-70 factor (ECF subfamily)
MFATGVTDIRAFAASLAPPRELRDEELGALLTLVSQGDPDALGPIYDACARELFAVAHWRTGSAADAADCVQDVFVKLAASPRSAGSVRHPRRFLITLAHRAAVDRVRSRRAAVSLDDTPFLTAPVLEPGRAADAERAAAALREIPAAQRETIYLHHFADLTFREIGRVTGVPSFTAASRYRLGMARLRVLLGEA